MGTADSKGKTTRPVRPSLQRTLEGLLERMREEVEGMFSRRQPVPIPIPIPANRRRR